MVKPLHAKYLPHAGMSPTVVIINNFETEKVKKKDMRINGGYVGRFKGFNCWDRYFQACATEVPVQVDEIEIMHMG